MLYPKPCYKEVEVYTCCIQSFKIQASLCCCGNRSRGVHGVSFNPPFESKSSHSNEEYMYTQTLMNSNTDNLGFEPHIKRSLIGPCAEQAGLSLTCLLTIEDIMIIHAAQFFFFPHQASAHLWVCLYSFSCLQYHCFALFGVKGQVSVHAVLNF